MRKTSLCFLLLFFSCVLSPLWRSGAAAQNGYTREGDAPDAGLFEVEPHDGELRDVEQREGSGKPAFDFDMNLGVGLSSYEDSTGTQRTYLRFGVFPEIGYGKWGLGLDLSLELDEDFRPRDLDNDGHPDRWTTLHDYITRIYYLSYGRRGDLLFGRISAIDSASLGHGLIADRYSNTVFLPQVIQLGLTLELDGALFSFPFLGFEAFVDDVLDWDVIGSRVYARPLARSANPLLRKMELGATYVTDLDTQEDPLDAPGDVAASADLSEYGVDFELTVFERERSSVLVYADWAKIVDGGSGALLGGAYSGRRFGFTGQLRFFGRDFAPGYFDSFYERDRKDKQANLAGFDEFTVGYLVGSEVNIPDAVFFSFRWEDRVGDLEGPRVLAVIGKGEDTLPRVDAAFTYDKKDVGSLSEFFSEENSLLRLTLGYAVVTAVKVALTFEKSYSPFSYPYSSADRAVVETTFSF